MEDGLRSKACSKCNTSKPATEFHKKKDCLGGRRGVCKSCEYQNYKVRTKTNGYKTHKTYAKTLKGYLVRTYANMFGRVSGIQSNKAHLYKGLSILPREDFYAWALTSNYPQLLKEYQESGYEPRLAPSVDRRDSALGYTLDNMRWITHGENSALGGANSGRKKTNNAPQPT